MAQILVLFNYLFETIYLVVRHTYIHARARARTHTHTHTHLYTFCDIFHFFCKYIIFFVIVFFLNKTNFF